MFMSSLSLFYMEVNIDFRLSRTMKRRKPSLYGSYKVNKFWKCDVVTGRQREWMLCGMDGKPGNQNVEMK